jgi:hypothetical protein
MEGHDAIATCGNQVQLRGGDSSKAEFFGELLGFAVGVTGGSYVQGTTGSTALGIGAGVAANTGMEQLRGLADDMLRAGERAWDELVGSSPAEGAEVPPAAAEASAPGCVGVRPVRGGLARQAKSLYGVIEDGLQTMLAHREYIVRELSKGTR